MKAFRADAFPIKHLSAYERRAMRIAFLISSTDALATTHFSFQLARTLAERGHEVTFIAVSVKQRFRTEWEFRDGVRILFTPKGVTGRWHYGGWGPHDILTRIVHLMREPYDVLVGVECRANVYLPFRAMNGRIPLRLTAWGDWWGENGLAACSNRLRVLQRWEEKWNKIIRLEADGVLVASRVLAAVAKEWGIPEARLCLIPHGSPVDRIQVLPKQAARRRIGLEENQPVIGYLSHTFQAVPPALPALRRVFARHPSATLLCIGRCAAESAATLEWGGVADHFHFSGPLPADEIGLWLACADLFLLPSLPNDMFYEAKSPGKLGDYLAAGRPIVAPDIGETARIIREEGAGLLSAIDMSDLDDPICRLIEDPVLSERLGAQARQAAEAHFAWPILAARFEQFVRDLVGNQSTVPVT